MSYPDAEHRQRRQGHVRFVLTALRRKSLCRRTDGISCFSCRSAAAMGCLLRTCIALVLMSKAILRGSGLGSEQPDIQRFQMRCGHRVLVGMIADACIAPD